MYSILINSVEITIDWSIFKYIFLEVVVYVGCFAKISCEKHLAELDRVRSVSMIEKVHIIDSICGLGLVSVPHLFLLQINSSVLSLRSKQIWKQI